MRKHWNQWAPLYLSIISTLIVFYPSFFSEFVVWDDNVFLTENSMLQWPLLQYLKEVFTRPFFGDFLPLTMALMAVIWKLGSGTPVLFHLVNGAVHCLNLYLLWKILGDRRFKTIKDNKSIKIFILLIFAIHPLQVESVAWVSELKGLLAAFFALLALNAWLQSSSVKDSSSKGSLANESLIKESFIKDSLVKESLWPFGFFYFCSLICKANFIFLPILPLVLRDKKEKIIKWGPVLALMFIWGLVRVWAYQGYQPTMKIIYTDAAFWLNLPGTILNAYGFYLRKALLPFDLSIIYPAFEWTPLTVIQSLLGLGFLIYFLFQIKKKNWESMFFCLLFLLPLIPILQIIPRINYVQDRYAYVPLMGAVFLMGLLILKLPRRFHGPVVIFFVLLMAGLSWRRVPIWENNLALWEAAAKRDAPWSALSHVNLGYEFVQRKDSKSAINHLLIASKLGADNGFAPLAYNLLANLYLSQNPPLKSEALLMYQNCLASRGALIDIMICKMNLAGFLMTEGKFAEARVHLDEIIQSSSDAVNDLKFQELINRVKMMRAQIPL